MQISGVVRHPVDAQCSNNLTLRNAWIAEDTANVRRTGSVWIIRIRKEMLM